MTVETPIDKTILSSGHQLGGGLHCAVSDFERIILRQRRLRFFGHHLGGIVRGSCAWSE
jgi:hypothetical protein